MNRRLVAEHAHIEPFFGDSLQTTGSHFQQEITMRFPSGAVRPGAFRDPVEPDNLKIDVAAHRTHSHESRHYRSPT